MRSCIACNEIKQEGEFYGRKDGWRFGKCKPCMKKYATEWTARNRDRARAAVRRWGKKNAERLRPRYRIKEARRRIAGDVKTSDLLWLLSAQKGRCAVCRIDVVGGYHIDHILPIALGGRSDKRNLQVLCPPCNLAKGAIPPIEFMQSRGMLL